MAPQVGSSRHGLGFWIAFAAGGSAMAVATWGAYGDLSLSSFGSWGKWIIGLDLVNDLIVLPLVALVGVGVARLPLGRAMAPVQAALFTSAVVLFVAFPAITERSASSNPTIQPLDYATATATVLGVVWVAAAAWALARRRGHDDAPSPQRSGERR